MALNKIMGDANLWGPLVWELLLASAYHLRSIHPRFEGEGGGGGGPIVDRSHYRRQFCHAVLCLEYILPCKTCRDAFALINRRVPVTQCLAPDVDPADWVFEVHNVVNLKLGKPCFPRRSFERKLNVAGFTPTMCARLVFVVSLWADDYCVTPARTRALNRWFEALVRLARLDGYLAVFNDAFRHLFLDGRPVDFLSSREWIRDRLADVLNHGASPRPRASYEATFKCIFS